MIQAITTPSVRFFGSTADFKILKASGSVPTTRIARWSHTEGFLKSGHKINIKASYSATMDALKSRFKPVDIEELRGIKFHQLVQKHQSVEKLSIELQRLAIVIAF